MLALALVFLLLGQSPPVTAGELTLPEVALPATESVYVPVSFTPGAEPVSGIQFDLEFDSTALAIAVLPEAAAESAAKSLYFAPLGPGRFRCLLVGFNRNPLFAGNVTGLWVSLTGESPAGQQYTLRLSGWVATNPEGSVVSLKTRNGSVTVTGPPSTGLRILNAASLLPGAVAPGQLVTLTGHGIGPAVAQQPTVGVTSPVLGGTRVLFGDQTAPLLFAAPSQINALAPTGIAGKNQVALRVLQQEQQIMAGAVEVAAASPAIFTMNASGRGAGAIFNQDGTINSPANPAERGSLVTIFATGAGLMDPPQPEGHAVLPPFSVPLLPVRTQIDGFDAAIQYAGAAPGLVSGILQVNCQVPHEAKPGSAVRIVLIIGGFTSPPDVTLAVR
jgi:uncharacterized protein (TIGR03437 family)